MKYILFGALIIGGAILAACSTQAGAEPTNQAIEGLEHAKIIGKVSEDKLYRFVDSETGAVCYSLQPQSHYSSWAISCSQVTHTN